MDEQKQALTLENFQAGAILKEFNAKIQEANAALDAAENPKAKAEITLKFELAPAGEGGHFRAVAATITAKAPSRPKKLDLLGVQTVDGKRVLVVDAPSPEKVKAEAAPDGTIAMFPKTAEA